VANNFEGWKGLEKRSCPLGDEPYREGEGVL